MRLPIAIALLASTVFAADPVAWTAGGSTPGQVKAGSRFSVRLTAKIQSGWHIYGLKPVADGPIPTRIWVADGQAVQPAGAAQGTEPQTMQDPAFNMEVELYEGEVQFTLPLRVASAAAAGAQKFVVNVSYQSCDNKICLPPKTVKLEVPVTVTK
jgi:thiol:disulfide interchange protein DsbD